MFNGYPTVALEKITTPLLTEVLQLAYTSYYFLPIILCATLKMKRKSTEFDRALFLIILCFFLSYIGYILVPVIGPRYTMNHLQDIELHGILLRDTITAYRTVLKASRETLFRAVIQPLRLLCFASLTDPRKRFSGFFFRLSLH